ncbi:MAG: ATP synthase F1 subunit delta [Proteobacteria bacterium]|nr:ATP synthase F1 subunit delta [Pseudomonadota bacterium]
MTAGSLPRRYARAVLQLGTDANNSDRLDKLAEDLRTLSRAMIESPELVSVMTNPAIRRADRRKVIDALLTRMAVQPHTKNLVYLLLDGERMGIVGGISRELDAMIDARSGRIGAEITSAKPLDPAQLSQITVALEKLSGKKIDVTKKVDPEIIGGVVAKVGDIIYDGSLRTQLRNLRDDLAGKR